MRPPLPRLRGGRRHVRHQSTAACSARLIACLAREPCRLRRRHRHRRPRSCRKWPSSGRWESLKLTPDDAPPTAPPPTRPTPRRGERQHDNQSANKRQTGGEAPVDKRRRGVKRQRLRVKRRGGRVKRTRGGGVNVTTSWQTRGKQEGTAPQKLAGLSKGQEAAAAARREAS